MNDNLLIKNAFFKKLIFSHHLVARVLANLGDYRSAIDEERQTLSIYSEKVWLGGKRNSFSLFFFFFKNPNDERVQTSSAVLNVLTHEAVRMQRQVNEMKGVESVGTKVRFRMFLRLFSIFSLAVSTCLNSGAIYP